MSCTRAAFTANCSTLGSSYTSSTYDDFDYIYEEFVLHVPAEDREEKPDTIRKWKDVLPRVIDIVAYKERCCVELCALNGWIALTSHSISTSICQFR